MNSLGRLKHENTAWQTTIALGYWLRPPACWWGGPLSGTLSLASRVSRDLAVCTPNTAFVALTTPRSHRAEQSLAHVNSRGRRNLLLLKLRNVLWFLTLHVGDSPPPCQAWCRPPRRTTTWIPAALMRTTVPHRVRGRRSTQAILTLQTGLQICPRFRLIPTAITRATLAPLLELLLSA